MKTLFLVLFLLFQHAPAFAGELTGKVIAIADGDTLTVLSADQQQIKIRLAEIDTPERPYSTRLSVRRQPFPRQPLPFFNL